MAANSRDRILIIEHDPKVADLIGRQALQATGFQVIFAADASQGMLCAAQESPDLIIADLNLPGLSGKDLLVALSAQGIATPVMIVAPKGSEAALIHTFRLGAADYLIWPVRETEVVAAVERQIRQVRERREREKLSRQLQQTNQELQMRVRELTTIFSIGKSVTTVIEQKALFEKILEGATSVTQANLGWFLIRDDESKTFMLAAHHNLPPALTGQPQQPLDESISSLVAMSGEPLSLYGDPLRRFKISALGSSALVVPIKAQKQVIGLLVVMRKTPQSFTPSEQHLLQAVADYACISMVNARLFRALEEKARALQTTVDSSEKTAETSSDLLRVVKKELDAQSGQAGELFNRLMREPGWWSAEQKHMLSILGEQIATVTAIAESIHTPGQAAPTTLNEIVQTAVARAQPAAARRKIKIEVHASKEKLALAREPGPTALVVDALLSNAVKYSPPGKMVSILVEKNQSKEAHLTVRDMGPGIQPRQAARIFQARPAEDRGPAAPTPFGGIGIGLPLAYQIVITLGGRIWVENKPGDGACFHLTLPLT